MIRYHGTPITPTEAAIRVLRGRHAFVSYIAQDTLGAAVEVCQSFAVDNGAFSVWSRGEVPDWGGFYEWVADVSRLPNFDWAVIPDDIDGDEAANDALLNKWPHGIKGVPVWHLHESLDRLRALMTGWPRICLGSSGDFRNPNSPQWWMRMQQVMDVVTDDDGYPLVKLHGLRMLNPAIFGSVPLSSADSTNVAQNCGTAIWRGPYEPATKSTKAIVIAERIEVAPHCSRWATPRQRGLFLEGGE